LGAIAIGESGIPSPLTLAQQDNLIIEQESSTEARKADLARKQTVEGALKALKLEMSENEVLRMGLWDAITSPVFTLKEVGELLQICELLYEAESSMTVVLKYPRYWQCTKVGKATLRFSPTGRIRTSRKMPLPLRHTLQPEPPAPAPAAALPKIKLQFQPPKPKADANGSSLPSASGPNQSLPAPSVPRRILKPPKKPVVANGPGVGVNSGSGDRLTQKAENVDGREKEVAAKPKLTLKLSLKGAGRTKQ
jgi:transcription initiation factor TFIID subunit 2